MPVGIRPIKPWDASHENHASAASLCGSYDAAILQNDGDGLCIVSQLQDRLGTEMRMAKGLLEDDFSLLQGHLPPAAEFGLDLMSRRILRLQYEIVFFGGPTEQD